MRSEKVNLVESFAGKKVLIVGDGLLDVYVTGSTDRICREAPVPVFSVISNKYESGGAANTAINVSLLGAESYFVTVLGKDQNGKILIDQLKEHKVHTECIILDRHRTTLAKKRIIASSNILLRIDEGIASGISRECEQRMLSIIAELYNEVDAIIISDYGYGIITPSLLELLREMSLARPKKIIVDAKDLRRYQLLKPTVIKPNYEEAVHVLGIEKISGPARAEQILDASDRLLKITGASKAAVTLDADGVLFIEKGKKAYRISCIPHENSRAIGAGDTFISALALSLSCQAEGYVAAEIAAAAAAVVVQKEGTAGCTNDELKSYINATPKYIHSVESLKVIASRLRKAGRRIVFTNGCFDIIHKGHITLLNKAREAGDVLIVGVNSDDSIRKLRGPDRPINRLEDRMTVLSGLASIDYLIPFEETSAVKLIRAVHPDVFVKGGDYSEETISEAPLVKKLGGVIKIVPLIKDQSTSGIISKIRSGSDESEKIEDLLLSELS